jgi:carbonic anhydrase/acetyltransferase-like protein (isoleucine patch superfamily)
MSANAWGLSRCRGRLFPGINFSYLALICGLPTIVTVFAWKESGSFQLLAAFFLPLVWTLTFLLTAGLLSLSHQFSVRPGKFRRDVSDRFYFHRRLYGLCWAAVFYNKPAYFLCLSFPLLKWITFRLFGYRGTMNFTVYPDTWIRDLPILTFEDGAYVSNRATLGTNAVRSNGFLLVAPITLRSKALVGHLAMLAPGVELGPGAEVAVGVSVGIKAKLSSGSFVGPCCAIGHGVRLGQNAAIGAYSVIESGSVILDDVKLPTATVIPTRTRIVDTLYAQRSSNAQVPADD